MSSLAIVLAAGYSQRFGADKRLAGSKPLIIKTLEQLIPAFDQVLLVHRFQDDQLLTMMSSFNVLKVAAPLTPIGQGESLAAGVKHLLNHPESYSSITKVAICLADMPYIKTTTYQQLISEATHNNIVRPYYQGKAGQPVLFGWHFIAELALCHGDKGARTIVENNLQYVLKVHSNDPGVLLDIDTQNDLR